VIGDVYHASREEMRRHKMSLLPEEREERLRRAHERCRQYRFREFDARRSPAEAGGSTCGHSATTRQK